MGHMELEYTKSELNEMLLIACEAGDLKVVKYLVSSPELKQHANIYTNDSAPIKNSLIYGHEHISDYLLSKVDFKKFSQEELKDLFELSCEHKAHRAIGYLSQYLETSEQNQFKNMFLSLVDSKNSDGLNYFFENINLKTRIDKSTIVKAFETSFKKNDFETAKIILINSTNEIDPYKYIKDYESSRTINLCNRQKNKPTPYQEIKDLLLLKMVNQKLTKKLGKEDKHIKAKLLKI